MEEFYKKKVIRDFLSQFSESKWKALTILCIEYGILQLKKNYSVSSLSLDDIEGFVDELIDEDKKNQRKNLKHKFAVDDSKSNSNQSNGINPKKNKNEPNRPSSNWRKGDVQTIFDNPNDLTHDRQTTMNDVSSISKITKEKMIDEILFPKKDRIVKYYKDNVMIGNDTKKRNRNRTSTSSTNSNRKLNHSSSFSGKNQQSTTMKFNSGLQKLQMKKRNETPNHNTQYYKVYPNGNTNTNNNIKPNKVTYPLSFNNVQSRIKSQIESDKKIYEKLKNKQIEDRNTFEERESSIIDKRSEMSFEEGFSSLV